MLWPALAPCYSPRCSSPNGCASVTRRRTTSSDVYVIGALVLAPLGAYGQYLDEGSGGPREFTTLAVVDAVMLMTTTLVAYLFAIRRRITQHRQWMTRSYAVALVCHLQRSGASAEVDGYCTTARPRRCCEDVA
jgi:hypothetical protein